MKPNVGSFDAAARFLIGCGLIYLSLDHLGWLTVLGALFVLSSATGFCLVYWLCHLDTAAWEAAYEDRHRRPRAILSGERSAPPKLPQP